MDVTQFVNSDPSFEYTPQLALDLIYRAAMNNHLACLKCKDKDGKDVYALVAAIPENTDEPEGPCLIWPLAKCFDRDPFAEVQTPEGCEFIDRRKPLQ